MGPFGCAAQSLKSCRTVFVRPMPGSLDSFVSAELVKWGAIKVVAAEDKADCVASFGQQATGKLPEVSAVTGLGRNQSQAALEVIHRESSVVLWASAKSSGHGPKSLAERLVAQLKKDYQKSK